MTPTSDTQFHENGLAKAFSTRKGTVMFSCESIVMILAQNDELVRLHVQELGETLSYRVSLDKERYYLLEDCGALRSYSARASGKLIGYATYFMNANPQAAGELHAVQNSLFLHPDWRRGRTGMKFISFCHQDLEDAGAAAIFQSVPLAKRDFGAVFEHMGFKPVERVYVRRTEWAK